MSRSSNAKTSRGIGDFFDSLVSVQQENGRILIYIGVMALLDLGLLVAIARLPPPDTYLVEGVKGVGSTTIYWNQSDEAIQHILGDIPGAQPAAAPGRPAAPPGPVAPDR